jgi:membrane protease YdiL (CAAX protease family)
VTAVGRTGSPSAASLARFAALALVAFYVPPLLIYTGLIPFSQRFAVLVAVAGALALVALLRGTAPRDLGLRADNLRPALAVNAVLALVVGAGVLAAFWLGLIRRPRPIDWLWFAPFYVLVSCPAQEFACRGFLFAEMQRHGIVGAWPQIVISAVTYAFLHIVYGNWLSFLAPLCIGLAWGAIYRRYPNLWAVILSHAALGLLSIAAGLV